MNGFKQTDVYRRWEARLKDQRTRSVVATRLLRLANGLAGDVRPVGEGISELRIHYGPGYRIYVKQQGKSILLLLCGGDKRSQSQDIFLAKMLAKAWIDEE
ncbi:type II toxin-antitoxin system RelE/ParE family toxin [Enterobacteriaceae bacterium H20N1]|uniref:Type II toxin-antitoxin system RelE/ParE family toxin n=1 Tax=Dryocola boscaweniae TaxID=2925397 RepID=A0A9X3ANY8_9ENTR|nr:type II toxin-antitoxin system RelE/ParE family toxin [Dryocola boscaweniae]MCT4700310.1 type II toxin-antitoxin system RelE/ParE family toxin [Dryocola boscaweniae]MCT4717537.1 type II toxin-antitoxin system RelE/ParE family toxin [Dryocola boscaweniae]